MLQIGNTETFLLERRINLSWLLIKMQTVRVRHNGEVIPIVALTIDESLCGGDEIYRFVCFALLCLSSSKVI